MTSTCDVGLELQERRDTQFIVAAKSARVTSREVGEVGNRLPHGFGLSINNNLPTFATRIF